VLLNCWPEEQHKPVAASDPSPSDTSQPDREKNHSWLIEVYPRSVELYVDQEMNPSTIAIGIGICVLLVLAYFVLRRSEEPDSSIIHESFDYTPTNQPQPATAEISSAPDTPQSFGYKMAWFAIPTVDPEKVLRAFPISEATPANWTTGVQAVYGDSNRVFVTPPVDGWTFVLGIGLPSLDTEEQTKDFLALIESVSDSFPDFYYFGTHRIVEFHSWVKVAGGSIQRAYAYLGERGETLYDEGTPTAEEIDFGFQFFDERAPESEASDYFDRENLRSPDEEDVMRISAAWTIDTQTLDQRTEKGTGHLARIN
jgi:hypothetical protein